MQLLNGHILTGTGGADTHVTIADSATVTLNGVNITTITNNTSHQWPGITCLGNATIVIGGSTTNSVNGGYQSSGIFVPQGKYLTLQGSGTLNATGSDYAAGIGSGKQQTCGNITISSGTINATGGEHGAGIGSGYYQAACGTIIINGGTVTATGGQYAAGIGSGYKQSDCWHITIYNTVTSVTATKGTGCDNAIGAGSGESTCRSVTISGIETGFITQSPFTTFPYTVVFNANGGTGTMNNQGFMYNVAENLHLNNYTRPGFVFEGWATSSEGPKVYDDEQSVSNLTATSGDTVTLYAKWNKIPYMVTLTAQSGEVLLYDGDTLTGTGGANTHVSIADGSTVLFRGVNITGITNDNRHQWAGITCLGNAVIILDGGTTNSVTGVYRSSGIYVPQHDSLTLQGSGTLNATGNEYAAGIGGGYGQLCGNITISQGVTVTATKGDNGEYAIGASTCGTVTIGGVQTGSISQSPFTTYPYTVAFNANGGTGTMTDQDFMYNVPKGLNANNFAYLQFSFDGWATSSDGPKEYEEEQSVINLTETAGDTVTLYAKWRSHLVTLTLESENVKLYDGDTLTGTGGANTHVKITDNATVTFSGVNITAISNDNNHQWPGIHCLGNAVIVLGGNMTNSVTGGYCSSGIYVPRDKTLTLQGNGKLNVSGSERAAGIGSSFKSTCGDIDINGGTVTATGGSFAAGIGSGYSNSSCGNITINSGTVTATGSKYAAGIGSGYTNSSCGTVTITEGVTRLTATKSSISLNTIGAGDNNSTCGTVTIGGVMTGFINKNPFVTFPYTVAFDANGGTGTMDNQVFMQEVEQDLTDNGFTHPQCSFLGWATSPNGPKVYDDGQSVINLADAITTVTLYAKWNALSITLPVAGHGTGNGGWHLIASPMAGNTLVSDVTNLITTNSTYDLYYFDQTGGNNGAEWKNYKAHCDDMDKPFIALANGQGYLYANSADVSLIFNSTPYTGNGEVTLTKTAGAQFEGWNLIGNPFGTAATLGDKSFYRMNTPGTEIIAAETNTVEAMEGVFVVAETDGETVTFTQANRATQRGDDGEAGIVLNLSQNDGTVIDRAIVRFGEGQTLPKFQMRENSTKIYIPQDGMDYAVVFVGRDAMCVSTEVPVHFKAEKNGIYTLTVSESLNSKFSINSVEGFAVLNLIDNLTGNNVDLLKTPSYTFEAKTTDYASRFKLVFHVDGNANDDEEAFAFLSNGNIILTADAFDASIQVIDMQGRVMVFVDGRTRCVPTGGFAPGVYVLRLINGEKVRTQKIVIQ